MKGFLWTFAIGAVAIWLWSRWKTAKETGGPFISFGPINIKPADATHAAPFYGPDVDPHTGGYLQPGAQPGTSAYDTQGPGTAGYSE